MFAQYKKLAGINNNAPSHLLECKSKNIYTILYRTYGEWITGQTEEMLFANIKQLVVKQRNTGSGYGGPQDVTGQRPAGAILHPQAQGSGQAVQVHSGMHMRHLGGFHGSPSAVQAGGWGNRHGVTGRAPISPWWRRRKWWLPRNLRSTARQRCGVMTTPPSSPSTSSQSQGTVRSRASSVELRRHTRTGRNNARPGNQTACVASRITTSISAQERGYLPHPKKQRRSSPRPRTRLTRTNTSCEWSTH